MIYMSILIPDSLLKYINLTSGNISPFSPYKSIEQILYSKENLEFIIKQVKFELAGLPGLNYDSINKILTVDFLRDMIIKGDRFKIDPRAKYPDPINNDAYKIHNSNKKEIDQLTFILSQEDPHYNPITGETENADWGFDVSSYKNGWKPEDQFLNNPINKGSAYWKPMQISMHIGDDFTGLSYGRFPGNKEYEPDKLKTVSAYEKTVPGFRYFSKAYDYTTSKFYPPSNFLSSNQKLARMSEGYEECGTGNRRKYDRRVSTAPELKNYPHYSWRRYNKIPPDFYFPMWGTI